jgi:hypothetical protein
MAWTALTFAYGSKLTSTKMTQLFDNFTAFANKDSGAPVLENQYITMVMHQHYVAGSYFIGLNGAMVTTNATTWAKVKEFALPKDGAIKVAFSLQSSNAANRYGAVFRNGTIVSSIYTGRDTLYVEDITSWTGGDLCQLCIYGQFSSYLTGATSFAVSVASADFAICGRDF